MALLTICVHQHQACGDATPMHDWRWRTRNSIMSCQNPFSCFFRASLSHGGATRQPIVLVGTAAHTQQTHFEMIYVSGTRSTMQLTVNVEWGMCRVTRDCVCVRVLSLPTCHGRVSHGSRCRRHFSSVHRSSRRQCLCRELKDTSATRSVETKDSHRVFW